MCLRKNVLGTRANRISFRVLLTIQLRQNLNGLKTSKIQQCLIVNIL